jgi:hypothetical protein
MSRIVVQNTYSISSGNLAASAIDPLAVVQLSTDKVTRLTGFIQGAPGQSPATVAAVVSFGCISIPLPTLSITPGQWPTTAVPFDIPIDPFTNPGASTPMISTTVTGTDGSYLVEFAVE